MIRGSLTLALLLLAALYGAAAGSAVHAAEIQIERAPELTRIEAVLPGRLLDFTTATAGENERFIVLLVEPFDYAAESDGAADPEGQQNDEQQKIPPCPAVSMTDASVPPEPARQLYLLHPSGSGGLALIRDDLPDDCRTVEAIDLDGDGRDELLLEHATGLLLVRFAEEPATTAAPPETIYSAAGVVWSGLVEGARENDAAGAVIFVMGLGSLHLFGPTEGAAGWQALGELELPIEGSLHGSSLRIRSSAPSFVGRRGDGTFFLATQPKAHLGRRLQTQLIEVDHSGKTTLTECWAALPEAEDLLESFFLLIDERPALLVTTKPAGKLGLFGEKRLRLYYLSADRSRLGIAPVMAVESRMNLWQESNLTMHDVNADGLEDLILGYWKGLSDDKVVLDVYLRQAGGTFSATPRTTAFNVKDGDRDHLLYGQDLDGDGVADLLLRDEENNLLLHSGLPAAAGKRLVSREPRTIALEAEETAAGQTVISLGSDGLQSWRTGIWRNTSLRLVDVDGDGRDEIVLLRRGSSRRPGAISLIRL